MEKEKENRFIVFDLLRGVAVLLMILAHSVYFFSDNSNRFFISAEGLGNTICFVIFVLVSGAVSYIAYLSSDNFESGKKKILKRLFVFLVSYYLLAFFVKMSDIAGASGVGKIGDILNVIFLRDLPSYTEYIPPFLVYSFILILFNKQLKKILPKSFWIIFWSIVLYLAGYFGYLLKVPEFLIPWKAFLFGAEGFYRFPIFQYAPVFLIGLYWGRSQIKEKDRKFAEELPLNLAGVFLLILLSLLIARNWPIIGSDNLFNRWPPTVGFLSIGLASSFLLGYFFKIVNYLKNQKLVRDFLTVFGQNTFPIFWSHIFILTFYKMAGGAKVDSIWLFLLFFAIVLVGSLALATFVPFNFRFGLSRFRRCREDELDCLEEEPIYKLGEEFYSEGKRDYSRVLHFFFPRDDGSRKRKRLIKKRHLIFVFSVIAAISFVSFPSIKEEVQTRVLSKSPTWWSDEFAYQKQIIIENQEKFLSIKKGEKIEAKIDYKKLVSEKKANFDGSDVRVMYWNGKDFLTVKFWVSDLESNNARIIFETVANIGANSQSKNYYIYYGGGAVESAFSLENAPVAWNYNYQAYFSKEVSFSAVLLLDRRWYLIDRKNNNKINLSLNLGENGATTARFVVFKTNVTGVMKKVSGNDFEATIKTNQLVPGKYQVQAEYENADGKALTQRASFYVSYPLEIAWTLDLEGYNESDSNLRDISDLADSLNAPLTIMFNPRIYVASDISDLRREAMTSWARNRVKIGDEIGMHLHMFDDFVKAAGVTPKDDPRFSKNFSDGYAALTTNYSEDEVYKMILLGLKYFKENELPAPKSYRAGGWYANLETLKAISNSGMLIDSSGRKDSPFGGGVLRGSWNLEAITAPYFPSIYDQNNPAKSESEKVGILEIPDNGGDSYHMEKDELIGNFQDNLGSGILMKKQAVTYVSHPRWWIEREGEKIHEVLNFIARFSNDKDSGPVVFSTLFQIYNNFGDQ